MVIIFKIKCFEKGKTEYVQFAEIKVSCEAGGTAVRSDANGRFSINIGGLSENGSVFFKISKAGYRVVNPAELQVRAGRKDTLRFSMTTDAYLTVAQRHYHGIIYTAASKNLLRLHDEKRKALVEMQSQPGANPVQVDSMR